MKLNYAAFLSTLPIMAKGMAGIFIVTGVIIIAVVVLCRFTQSNGGNK